MSYKSCCNIFIICFFIVHFSVSFPINHSQAWREMELQLLVCSWVSSVILKERAVETGISYFSKALCCWVSFAAHFPWKDWVSGKYRHPAVRESIVYGLLSFTFHLGKKPERRHLKNLCYPTSHKCFKRNWPPYRVRKYMECSNYLDWCHCRF